MEQEEIILFVDDLRYICNLKLTTVTFPLSEQSACEIVHSICNLIDEKKCKKLLPWPFTDSRHIAQFRLGVRKFSNYVNEKWNANVVIITPIAIVTPASPKFITYLHSLCRFATKFVARQKYDNYRWRRWPEKHQLVPKYYKNKMVEIATLASDIPIISLEDKEKELAELINANKIIGDKLENFESQCSPYDWAKIIERYQNALAALKERDDASFGSNSSVYQDFEGVLSCLKFFLLNSLNSLDGDIILSQLSQDKFQKLQKDFQVQIVSNGKLCFNGYINAVKSILNKIVKEFENAEISDQLLAEIKANELNLDRMYTTLFESTEPLEKQIIGTQFWC